MNPYYYFEFDFPVATCRSEYSNHNRGGEISFFVFSGVMGGGDGRKGNFIQRAPSRPPPSFPVRVVKATSPACDIVSLSQSASAKASGSPDVKSIPLPKFRPRSYRPPLGFSRKGGAG